MIDPESLEKWLVCANLRYREEGVPPKQRPLRALIDLDRENFFGLLRHPDLLSTIYEWFSKNTKVGSFYIHPIFQGCFYFDNCFWPIEIPTAFGRVNILPINFLITMNKPLKDALSQDDKRYYELQSYFSDCLDYAYGFDDVCQMQLLSERSMKFLKNADAHLRGAIEQTLSEPPIHTAVLNFRMAYEIFFKTLLIQEKNIGDRELKDIGHNLRKLASECGKVVPGGQFALMQSNVCAFPDVSSRYDGDACSLSQIWEAARTAQWAAATVSRHHTSRDTRNNA